MPILCLTQYSVNNALNKAPLVFKKIYQYCYHNNTGTNGDI